LLRCCTVLYWYSKLRRLVCCIEMLLGRLVPYKAKIQGNVFHAPSLTTDCDDRSAKAKTALPTTLFFVIFLAGSRASIRLSLSFDPFQDACSGGQQRAGRLE